MAVTIDEIEIELPSAESTPPASGAAPAAAAWNATFAQRLADELRIAAERAARIAAD